METQFQKSDPNPSMRAANENNNNYRYHGMQNNNQAEDKSIPVPPLVGDDSIVQPNSLADEIYNFFSSGDDNNFNAAVGTHPLFGEGFQGFDPLIAIKDCVCKTPLLDALKKQTEATTREKEAHDVTRSKRIMSEREVTNLQRQITDYMDREAQMNMENNDLKAQVEQLQTRVQEAKEEASNADTLIERIRSELVVKHGEHAREVQRAQRAEADVEILEQQVESLQRQVGEYDEERIALERGRNALQTRFVEGVAKFKTLKVEAEMEKDELAQFIAVMQEQVKVMSSQKTAAEQESRSYREKLETMAANLNKYQLQIRSLEEALTKEEAEHSSQIIKLNSEIGRLEELVDSIRSKAVADVAGLDRSRGQCNNLLLRATKEIAHLDQTTEDLKNHLDAVNKECQSLQDSRKTADEEFKFKEETWKDEREKLIYEINRLKVIGSEMEESRNEAEVKIINLEEELSNSERFLQISENDAEKLAEDMDKRTETLNKALQKATEKLHEEIEGLKAALRAKSQELQEMKSAVNSAGGDVSLIPLNRDDYQRALRESEELKRENTELVASLRQSEQRESQLLSELDNIYAADEETEGGGEEVMEVTAEDGTEATRPEEKEDRETRLVADMTELQAKFDELQEGLALAEEEKRKLINVLKENLEAKPIDINAQLYQMRMAQQDGNDRENRAEGVDDNGENEDPTAKAPMTGGTSSRNSRNSLEALTRQVKVARNYQLNKGVGEAMQRHGLDIAELADMAKTYGDEHMDFNKILDDVLHKAQKYRAEKVALTNQLKEFKVEIHFLKMELSLYKELEVKMKELGNLDDETVKNAKVDVAEKRAKEQRPSDLDPDVQAAVANPDYPKSSIVKMTTMFAEQKHILDLADEFHTLDDLLRALREDITTETRALKKEIESIIRLVDSMKEDSGEKNANNVSGGGSGGTGRMDEDEERDESDRAFEAVNNNRGKGADTTATSATTMAGSRGGSLWSKMAGKGASRGSEIGERKSVKSGDGKKQSSLAGKNVPAKTSGATSPTKASNGSSALRESVAQRLEAISRRALEANEAYESEDVAQNRDVAEEENSLQSTTLELTEDEEQVDQAEATVETEFVEANSNAETSSKGDHRSMRVDFDLPPDSNKNNLSAYSGCLGPANWGAKEECQGNAKTKQILREATWEVEELDVIETGGSAKRRRDDGQRKRTIRQRADSIEEDAATSESGGGVKSGSRFAAQQAYVTDEQGNKWVTDDAGRKWVVDDFDRKWRLGLDGRQYMIDEAGIKWTVEEVDGRRRRWRRNRRGEYVYAEEDGVEWVVDEKNGSGGGREGCARRRDEAGNEIMRDENGLEWILDEVGRGWRDNEKGQTILLDDVGRTWKFDHDSKGMERFGHRRDALGQKWMIDLDGAAWLVADDRRGWRVDSNLNVFAIETGSRGKSGKGADTRWMLERSSGIQWLLDERCQKLRAATKREIFQVPLEVKMALNVDFETDVAYAEDRSVVSRKEGRRTNDEKSGRSSRRSDRSERRKRRSDSEVWTEDSGKDSAESYYSSKRRGKRSRPEMEGQADDVLGLSRTPSLLRAKAEKLRRKAAERQAALSSAKNANNAATPPPEKTDRPSYFASTWGM